MSTLLQLPLEPLWNTAIGFTVLSMAVVGGIGIGGRNLAVASMGAYMVFAFYATTADIPFLEPVMYVTLTLIIIGSMMKLWRLEGFETGS